MPRYDATSATCTVFTFKEGLLSPLAHDLQIEVRTFWVDIDDARCTAELDARSLYVVTARKDERPHDTLSAEQKETIRATLMSEVLHSDRFPAIRFESTDVQATSVTGTLTLHGTARPVSVRVEARDGRRIGTVELHQPDFGIKPYRAALGTLKVKPDVRIEIALPEN
jgi:polyisoprenoid-binding protein YceI